MFFDFAAAVPRLGRVSRQWVVQSLHNAGGERKRRESRREVPRPRKGVTLKTTTIKKLVELIKLGPASLGRSRAADDAA